jgi:hypothetical protein
MFRTKSVVAAVTVVTMIASSAFAADTASLKAGKPSGVQKAQLADIGTGTLIVGLGAVAVITAIAITVGNQSGNNGTPGNLGTNNTANVTPATST